MQRIQPRDAAIVAAGAGAGACLPPVLCPLPRQQGTKRVLAPGDHESLAGRRDRAFGKMLADPPHEDVAVVRLYRREDASSRDIEWVRKPVPIVSNVRIGSKVPALELENFTTNRINSPVQI